MSLGNFENVAELKCNIIFMYRLQVELSKLFNVLLKYNINFR